MRVCVAVLAVVMASGCAAPAAEVDVAAEEAELMRISREWSDAAAAGAMDAVVAVWADDAVMMVPGQAPIRGSRGIAEHIASTGSVPGFAIEWEPLEAHVSASGDMGYLLERNRISWQDSTGAQVTESNKVVTVWRKQPDGSWKNVVDMWNADPGAWDARQP